MKHSELLADINSDHFINSRTIETPYHALRAVVELHKNHGECGMPTSDGTYPCPATNTCEECGTSVAYPCPTIQAIEKELR